MGIVVYSPYYGVMQDFDPQPRSSHISSRSAWEGCREARALKETMSGSLAGSPGCLGSV